MFVVSKNHSNRKLETHAANEFYLLHDDKFYEKWEPPENAELTSAMKKAHFGIPKKQSMIIHTIHAVGDNEKELQKRIKDKNHPDKIRNKTRYSVDRSSIPMSELKPYDALKSAAAVDTKRNIKKAKAAGQMGNANDLVRSRKRKSQDASGNNDSESDDTERNVKKPKADGQMGNANDFNLSQKRNSHVANNDTKVTNDNDMGDEQDSSEKQEMSSNCNGNCQMTDFYRKELLAAQQRITELQTETRVLQESNRKTVEDFSAQLAALNKNLKPREGSKKKQKSDDVTNHNKPFLDNAREWIGACMPNDTEVPQGMVHFGDNIFVEKKDIASKVEATSMEVRKRLKALLELIYPEDILQRTLDVKKAKFPNPLPISPTTVTIIAMALDKMLWDGSVDVTRSSISSTIRRVMNTMREDAKTKSLSAEEQEARRKIKAEKVKASRAAKKKGNPGPRKSKPGKKNAVSSSDEDSQEEDKDDDSQDEQKDEDNSTDQDD